MQNNAKNTFYQSAFHILHLLFARHLLEINFFFLCSLIICSSSQIPHVRTPTYPFLILKKRFSRSNPLCPAKKVVNLCGCFAFSKINPSRIAQKNQTPYRSRYCIHCYTYSPHPSHWRNWHRFQ